MLFERQSDAVLHERDAVFRDIGMLRKKLLDELVRLTDFVEDPVAVLRSR